MTASLPALPLPPKNVRYALTVPQSVLFAELSLDGSRKWAFAEAMQIDYEPAYIAIDNGAMSWNCDDDPAFRIALNADESPALAVSRFINSMSATARMLECASRLYPSVEIRRKNSSKDLIEDLTAYWHSYKLHMASLFTFWNAEYILSSALTGALEKEGKQDEILSGLSRFFRPAQENYYVIERRHLRHLATRFSPSSACDDSPARSAFRAHSNLFGFLLAPFNLGAPPSAEEAIQRAIEMPQAALPFEETRQFSDAFDDLPCDIRLLAFCARQLAFWKSERLDMMSLADNRAQSLFEEAADLLRITIQQLFAMTSPEILASLQNGKLEVPLQVLAEREKGYCIALVNGKIAFYQPTLKNLSVENETLAIGDSLRGIPASAGEIIAKIRILNQPEESADLKPGEILVTKMTRPEMGVALDHAAAFVTDEGGLMCHAAIISRELKKPCVIGTGSATRKLVNGDMVKVDGTTGLVTLLGR